MARDHFVAQTYLRHWADPASEKLYGYGKLSGKEFPCATKDVCREWDWDVNPAFKDNPRLLGEYRKIFEPHWKPAVAAARARLLSSEDKFALSGYWALLTTCTPAWHRHAVEVAAHKIAEFIPFVAKHLASEKPEYKELVEEVLAEGRIQPDPDKEHIKAILTQHVQRATFLYYQLDWTLLRNDTDAPFITSDNPSSILPRSPFVGGLIRFLPLAPDFALLAIIDPRVGRSDELPDLDKVAPGRIRYERMTRRQVARFNRVVVMNADELILTTQASRPIRRLVRNHRDFEVTSEHAQLPMPGGGHISAATMVIRRKRDAA